MIERVLFLESSPRHDYSHTTNVARCAIAALERANPWVVIDHAALWLETLPRFVGPVVAAKYSVFADQALDDRQREAWSEIEECVERFKRADLILITAPMWNFSVPYVLKHYIDVVTQPKLVFEWSDEVGYRSLLSERPALLITSSGGDYSPESGNAGHDFHRPYLIDWLTRYMGCRVHAVSVAPTIAGEDIVAREKQRAVAAVINLVEGLMGVDPTDAKSHGPAQMEDRT